MIKVTSRTGQRTSVEAFDVIGTEPAQDPSVKSLGVTGTVTSARANIIVVDDMETKKNARTASGRELLYEVSSEFGALLTAGAKQFMVYLGTRHHRDSVYHRIREERGFTHYICPVLFPANKKEVDEYKGLLAPHIYKRLEENPSLYGNPTDERFTIEEIEKKRLEMGKTAFEMQMMLRIESSEEFYPLSFADVIITNFSISKGITDIKDAQTEGLHIRGKRFDDKVRYYPSIGKEIDAEYTVIAVDPSGRGKDLFAYSIISVVHGRYFIQEINGLEGGYKDSNLVYILEKAKKYNSKKMYIEDNFGDGTVTALLNRVMGEVGYRLPIEGIRNYKNKTERIIDTLEPLYNQGRIILHKRVIEQSNRIAKEYGVEHAFCFQMSHLIKDGEQLEHDDCIDSLELGLSQIIGVAKSDPYQRRNQQLIEEQRRMILERFGEEKGYNATDNY
jgi:hypothetical protein